MFRLLVSKPYFGVANRHSIVTARKLSKSFPEDTQTHTGQRWDRKDTRLTRFIDKGKEINTRFAINLLSEEPVAIINDTHVYCGGELGALGHPKVYINLDKPHIQSCGYCGKTFVAKQFKELATSKS
ncbi:NADH dehydrogenase [Oopsacas minuta]|uniref:NADH dehydrogenase n=1 Tax=Oopsacas minuta TaxID=111878 RepID=A0AAV7JGD0_9METZ|nr:NADH dehydrogenase [Oopsacas minuta]